MKFIFGALVVFGIVLFAGGGVVAQSASNGEQSNDARELVSVIDDVDVPIGVLISVQNDHLGYAVTQADEVGSGGNDGYRLRINRDDSPNGGEGIYLTFDKDWELIDERERSAAPEPEDDDEDGEDERERRRSDDEDDEDDDEPGPVGGNNGNGPPEGRLNDENDNDGNEDDGDDDDDDENENDEENESNGNGSGNGNNGQE